MRPLYKVGDIVYHGNSKCKVTKIVNQDDYSDFKHQGYRYYVVHSGHTWSVPELSLNSRPVDSHTYISNNSRFGKRRDKTENT